MDIENKRELSEQLNLMNISIKEIIDLTEIMLLGLESEKVDSMEMVISGICILNKLLKDKGLKIEYAIDSLDGSV